MTILLTRLMHKQTCGVLCCVVLAQYAYAFCAAHPLQSLPCTGGGPAKASRHLSRQMCTAASALPAYSAVRWHGKGCAVIFC